MGRGTGDDGRVGTPEPETRVLGDRTDRQGRGREGREGVTKT